MTKLIPTTVHDFIWQGRDDFEDGEKTNRLHHITNTVQPKDMDKSHKGIAIIGFCSDTGVKRNKGRTGARKAPNLIRNVLANMAWHKDSHWFDLGNINCHNNNLEKAQQECAKIIEYALNFSPVITLGGGHETAWASFQGLAQHLKNEKICSPKIGIINFDAHFDLRSFKSYKTKIKPSSGTPFYQIADYCHTNNWEFNYACLGVAKPSNTTCLFQRADRLGVWYIEDKNLGKTKLNSQLEQLDIFIKKSDYIYLTIDLDVFPAYIAPGVSSPAATGVTLENITPFLNKILTAKNKLMLADIVEYNPEFDNDFQTARLAARLCWDIACAINNKNNKIRSTYDK